MTLMKRASTAALIAATLTLGASAAVVSANAAPAANAANSRILSANSDLMKVQDRRDGGEWRGHRGDGEWRRGRHRGYYDDGLSPGAYLGLGVAGAIIDGALNDDSYDYEDGPGYTAGSSGAMQQCAATFRSFEWDTGLYTTYQGDKRLCPYLG